MTALAGFGAASSAQAQFIVTNKSDAGANSLRDAITQANAAAGTDDIQFNIPGAGAGRHVIHLATDLPAITDPIEIRGYSQPGAVQAAAGVPALIKLVIDAGQVDNGLVLETDDSLVRGLVIHTASGAAPDGVGLRVEGDRNKIEGNYMGLDGDEQQARSRSATTATGWRSPATTTSWEARRPRTATSSPPTARSPAPAPTASRSPETATR